jgi:membrane protease YdiL (CAAX protease family)
MKSLIRNRVRPVALTLIAPVAGFLLIFLLEAFLNIELSEMLSALINLAIVALIAFWIFPQRLGIPFGRVETGKFLRGLGLYLPDTAWRHIALGLILAVCTLSGMLTASLLSGKYVMDTSTIDFPHLVFSLNPALWEELFYRGVMMVLLIKFTRSLKQAFVIQILLFALFHFKGLDIWAIVDVFSVLIMAIGFTYVAYKTGALIAGIVFHYFHDAFLFFVQLPDGDYTGVIENLVFYACLWMMIAIGMLITRWTVKRPGLRTPRAMNYLARI